MISRVLRGNLTKDGGERFCVLFCIWLIILSFFDNDCNMSCHPRRYIKQLKASGGVAILPYFGMNCSTYASREVLFNLLLETSVPEFVTSSITSVFCVTTGLQPLSQRILHRVQSSGSSFNFHYPPFSLRSSSSCLPLLPRLPVVSSIFPSVTCFRR